MIFFLHLNKFLDIKNIQARYASCKYLFNGMLKKYMLRIMKTRIFHQT